MDDARADAAAPGRCIRWRRQSQSSSATPASMRRRLNLTRRPRDRAGPHYASGSILIHKVMILINENRCILVARPFELRSGPFRGNGPEVAAQGLMWLLNHPLIRSAEHSP